jgi:hypothetical protein
MPFIRQDFFDPFYMDIGIFPAAAVPHIHGELEHLETVSQDVFTEFGIDFTLCLGFRRQIKKYEYPQNAIGV